MSTTIVAYLLVAVFFATERSLRHWHEAYRSRTWRIIPLVY
jgi:hypothetical protein